MRVPGARVSFWPRRGSRPRQLGGRRLAAFAHRGQPGLLQLLEQGRRVRSDARVREQSDGPLALGLRDRPRRGGVDHGHVGDRHEEQRPAHREDAQDGPLLVHLALDRGRRRRRHPRPRLQEHAGRVGRVEHDDGRGGVGKGRNLRAGGQCMPQADPGTTFLDRDVGSRVHRLTIATVTEAGGTRRRPGTSAGRIRRRVRFRLRRDEDLARADPGGEGIEAAP